MTFQRVIAILAGCAVILAIGATLYLGDVLFVQPARPLGNWYTLTWLIVATVMCTYVAWVLMTGDGHRGVRRSLWVVLGLLLGFVVAGAWSVGLFYFPSWLLLTLLAGVDHVRRGGRRRVVRRLIVLPILVLLVFVIAAGQVFLMVGLAPVAMGQPPQFGFRGQNSGSASGSGGPSSGGTVIMPTRPPRP